MRSIARQVSASRLRRCMAIPLLAGVFALSGAPVANLGVDKAAAGGKSSNGSDNVSTYGRKVRR